jgi:UDP-N-acetylmuramate dehydrogenase
VVSDKHANFIVNTGTATASDVKQLVQKIQSTIQEKNGVTLVPEVFFLGFSPDESKA